MGHCGHRVPMGQPGEWADMLRKSPLLTPVSPYPIRLQLQNTSSENISRRQQQGVKPGTGPSEHAKARMPMESAPAIGKLWPVALI